MAAMVAPAPLEVEVLVAEPEAAEADVVALELAEVVVTAAVKLAGSR